MLLSWGLRGNAFGGTLISFFICALGLSSQAHAQIQPTQSLRKISATELPSLTPDGSWADLQISLRRQLASCAKLDPSEIWKFGKRRVSRRTWCTDTSAAFLALMRESRGFSELFEKAKQKFEWYQSIGRDQQGSVLFTGYYSPLLSGTTQPDSQFRYPLYRKPDDLVLVEINGKKVWRKKNSDGTFSPYFDRKAIDVDGVLAGQGLEIAYIDDFFSASIFHVQGSGSIRIELPDGSHKRMMLNYAAQNGHPYVSPRKILADQGVPEEYLTIPGQRRYFQENPDKLVSTLIQNPSYIFFTESDEGPYGVEEILLSPGHSIAVDLRHFPVGALAFFKSERPVLDGRTVVRWEPFTRFAMNQDTGGAIRGPGRVDIYWGEDEYAEIAAGTMAQSGALYFAILPEKKRTNP